MKRFESSKLTRLSYFPERGKAIVDSVKKIDSTDTIACKVKKAAKSYKSSVPNSVVLELEGNLDELCESLGIIVEG